ncbi:apolipoprotein N-acyltransferase [Aurantimonas aggregata]|uniref:Apolipoprotein N-acyltransferase n=1 Tax=Aurantimonas aggregata TaxID=2047720 RepID=A0A6L9MFL6_9HYPH|nr:apolipoprotein N-acyltransferase [Aurantimonas aggregata]
MGSSTSGGKLSAITRRGGIFSEGRLLDRLASRVLLVAGWRRALLTFGAGALATLALPPFNFPAVGFISFPLLVWLIDGAAFDPSRSLPRRLLPVFATGWLFGFGYFVADLWWLGAAMLVDAAEFAVFIPLAVLGLPAILAIYYGVAAALARLLWSDSAYRVFALAAAFGLVEYLRAFLFTGFPWNEIGVMAAPVPLLMQTASLVGVHGLTLLAVIVFSAPAVLVDRRGRMATLAVAAVLLVLHVGFGAWQLATHPTEFVDGVNVRVVQPNIQQTQKWQDSYAETIFERHIRLTETRADPAAITGASASAAAAESAVTDAPATRTLVIWPESAFPFLLTERPDAIARIADTLLPGETLIAGAARLEGDIEDVSSRVYNSVYVIDDNGEIIDARDKVHLVPFGEYLPFQTFFEGLGVSQLADMPGGFSPGAVRSRVPLDGAPSFLPLICYEIIFPGEIDAGSPETRPGFLVNDTNDAWYGATPGPYQHLRLAELTAVALGLPLVRSANTGISVVNDSNGRQIGGLALGSTGTVEVALPEAGAPTAYASFGSAPFWLSWIAALAAGLLSRFTMRAKVD